jgi:cytoskeletal protein CcmA (bactofilin family)
MARAAITPDPIAINLIGVGSEVEGTLRSSTDVRINGKIIGDLIVKGKVIIAEKGVVEGTVSAQNADIAGTIRGDLEIEERLVLKASSNIQGAIRTGRFVVEEGAQFEGSCAMGRLDPARKMLMGDGHPEGTSNTEFVLNEASTAAG